MKNLLLKSRGILLLLCCIIFTTIKLSAQTYFPLPTQNAYWTVYEWDENRLVYDDIVYTVDGDTLLNNLQYTKVYKLNDHPTIFDTIRTLHCFMRQDNEAKKIWFIRHYLGETTEKLGYDLSVNIGDTVSLPAFDYGNVGDSIYIRFECGYVTLNNGETRQQYCFGGSTHPIQFIEGVTGYNNTFPDRYSFWDPFHQTVSVCVEVEDYTIWTNGVDTNEVACGFKLVSITNPIYSQVEIFPNPANNYCLLDLPLIINDTEVTLIDVLGKPVYNIHVGATKQINIDLTRIPAGIYLIRVKITTHTFYNKLIVQH